jgi:hypothetical protein
LDVAGSRGNDKPWIEMMMKLIKAYQQVHFEHVERTMTMKQRKARPMQMSSTKVRPIPQSVHYDPKSLKTMQ